MVNIMDELEKAKQDLIKKHECKITFHESVHLTHTLAYDVIEDALKRGIKIGEKRFDAEAFSKQARKVVDGCGKYEKKIRAEEHKEFKKMVKELRKECKIPPYPFHLCRRKIPKNDGELVSQLRGAQANILNRIELWLEEVDRS